MHSQTRPTTIVISAVGQAGEPGTYRETWGNNFQAQAGSPGRHGRHASHPTAGSHGQNIHIKLAYDNDRPGLVQVSGQKYVEVSPAQTLLLDCRGGDGGAGGFGEDGQPGGCGFNGRDATMYYYATDGTAGQNGGDGGRGTSGAAGGRGGAVYVTVSESDLDTLIPLEYSISGGKGGPPGGHGSGGRGGEGGYGGRSYTWSTLEMYTYVDWEGNVTTGFRPKEHHHPRGRDGPGGQCGRRDTTPLYRGQDGSNGSTQITVIRGDNSTALYPSRYMLVVEGFDVRDENDDGINEPGEYVIVSNIRVKNVGKMPSPGKARLSVQIRETSWLTPGHKPLELPALAPGMTALLPGTLTALIRMETTTRSTGTTLRAKDTVSLRAYSERLQRDVPEFENGVIVPITYQYPLLLHTPTYLDCVAKGCIVRSVWTIENISSKSIGHTSTTGWRAGTSLSDPKGMFALQRAASETPHAIVDMIDILDPGCKMVVTLDFEVRPEAGEYSTGHMLLDLMLSEPHSKKNERLRVVQNFDLQIQVSPSYRYNPSSRFLLVINAQALDEFVLNLVRFIEDGLCLGVDVLNLSLSGSFGVVDSGEEDVLLRYTGKTIIILGNTMNYFQHGTREPWDLLDHRTAFSLVKAGTSFLFVAPTNMESLRNFVRLLAVPDCALPLPDTDCTEGGKLSNAIAQLKTSRQSTSEVMSFPVKKKKFRDLGKTLEKTGMSVEKQVNKALPLRSFIMAPCDLDLTAPRRSEGLAIVEGLPHSAKIVASTQPYSQTLTDYTVATITHSLPFADACSIFWNILQADLGNPISTRVAYAGTRLREDGGEARFVSSKACEALIWSIMTQLASELSHFSDAAASRCPIPQSALLSQLPLLSQFISSAALSSCSRATLTQSGASSLVSILGYLRGISAPLGAAQWIAQNIIRLGNRRKKLRGVVVAQVSDTFAKLLTAPPPASTAEKQSNGETAEQERLKAKMMNQEAETRKYLRELRKKKPALGQAGRAHEIACAQLALLTNGAISPAATFIDLNNTVLTTNGTQLRRGRGQRSVAMGRAEIQALRSQRAKRKRRVAAEAAWSRDRVKSMVRNLTNVVNTGFGPPTGFPPTATAIQQSKGNTSDPNPVNDDGGCIGCANQPVASEKEVEFKVEAISAQEAVPEEEDVSNKKKWYRRIDWRDLSVSGFRKGKGEAI